MFLSSGSLLCLPQKIALQNYDLLMNCRPGVEFNCSQLMHPERVRAVLKNVAKEHPGSGQAERLLRFNFTHVHCPADAVAQVTTLTLCSNALVDSDQLLNLLQDFSSLKHLNISNNSTLRFLTVNFMIFVTRLQSFICNDCSLVFPPQREVSFQLDHPDVDVQYAVKGIQRFLNESNINLSNTKMDAADALKIASELQHLFSNLQSESSQSQSPITINISKNPELKGSRLEGLGSGCLLILSKLEGVYAESYSALALCPAVMFALFISEYFFAISRTSIVSHSRAEFVRNWPERFRHHKRFKPAAHVASKGAVAAAQSQEVGYF